MSISKKIIIPIAVVTAVAAVYAGGAAYYKSHMMPKSTLLDADVSGMDRDALVGVLDDSADSYSLDITGDTTSDTIYGKEISLTLDRDAAEKGAEEIISSQDVTAWPLSFFRKEKAAKVPELTASFDIASLDQEINGTAAMTAEPVKSEDATYELSGDKYVVVPEVYGTEVDKDKLMETATEALKKLDESISLRDSGCYIDPKVKKDNKKLGSTVKSLNKYMKADITYDLGTGKSFTVDKADQAKWLKVNKKGKVSFDDEALYAFAHQCGYKYNTFGLPRKLKTQYGKTITVKGGSYGWWINYDAEVKQLKADVKAGKDVEREFIYRSTAANHGSAAHDYGNSYAEVNIATQHMFLVINGKKVLDSDVVTGTDVDGRRTPLGTYGLTYKTKDATLNGENYSTPVQWWMPFNGNVGFHDAPWRHGNFGGKIYKTNGSHGCVNLPPAIAKKLYTYVQKGFPVLVYNKKMTDEERAKAETGFKPAEAKEKKTDD